MDLIAEFNEKYKIALENEQLQRDISFIFDHEYIGNTKVYSLTPKLLSLLSIVKNNIICGGEITNETILSFLWTIKVKDTNEKQSEFVESVIVQENINEVLQDINDYFKNTFSDQLSGKENVTIPYWSNLAAIIDLFAREYGWSENIIINTPYKRLFQYIRIIVKRNNPEKILFNSSDTVKSELARKLSNI